MAKAVEEFRLKYEKFFSGVYHWDIEREVKGKEFFTTLSVSPTCRSI